MTSREPIYLDNAATSHPKPEAVYQAVEQALRLGASPGRGGYQQSLAAERWVFDAREALADFFHAADPECFVFTANATTAINQALFGLLRPGERVVTTSVEHNAVTRPLRALQELGVEVVKVAAAANSGIVAAEDLQSVCLQAPTRLLLVNHCSNVFGAIQPVEELGAWCREQGILFMIDGAQSAGCLPIDFQALEVDLFAAPGHKGLLGPQGTGFLYLRPGLQLTPLMYGGTGTNSASDLAPEGMPERFETGTPNLPGIAGLGAGVRYLLQQGVTRVREHELQLVQQLLNGLGTLDGVKLYGPEDLDRRGGAVSFVVPGHDPAELGYLLDQEEKIAVRVGLHCAPDAHRTVGSFPLGSVRVSPGIFTTEEQIDRLLTAVRRYTETI